MRFEEAPPPPPSSPLLCVISPLPPSCLCHNFTPLCCNFNVSIFHLIFPEQRAVPLNNLAALGNLGEESNKHAHAHYRFMAQGVCVFFGVGFFAREKRKMVIVEL